MLPNRGENVPRGASGVAVGSAVIPHAQTEPTHKDTMQVTPMFRGLSHYPPSQMPLLTLEDSMAAQILGSMSPKRTFASSRTQPAPESVTGVGRVASLSSPKVEGCSAPKLHNGHCSSQLIHRSSTKNPRKRACRETSDDEDDHAICETNSASDQVDNGSGVILSEEIERQILTRPPKPEGSAEWRVEWSTERGCWSWVHHTTCGQIFTSPLKMESDARDQAAASAPVAFVGGSHLSPEPLYQQSSLQKWTAEEEEQLKNLVAKFGAGNWSTLSSLFNTDRSASALRHRWYSVHAKTASKSISGEQSSMPATRIMSRYAQSPVRRRT